MWRTTYHTCPKCNGTGKTHNFAPYTSHVANPGNAPCLNCYSTGRIEKREWEKPSPGTSGAVNIDPSTGRVQCVRTPEQQRNDLEEGIASLLSLTLGVIIAGPLLWQGAVAWWIALGLGGAIWFGLYKLLSGPMRFVAVLVRLLLNAITWALAIGTVTAAVTAFLYIVYQIGFQNG